MEVDSDGVLQGCPANYGLGGGEKQGVAVCVVLNDNQSVGGDSHESLHLQLGGAVFNHHTPREGASQPAAVRAKPGPQLVFSFAGK